MAMILYDYYNYHGWATNPGKIYAALIAFGGRPYPDFDNEIGVGHVTLGNLNCRHWYTGARNVSDGGYVDIPFTTTDTGNGDRDLRFAIWWPEETGSHNDIDLRIYDSNMTQRGSSLSSSSIFEFSTVGGALTPTGTWRARILGTDVPDEPQTVYFLLYKKTWCAP